MLDEEHEELPTQDDNHYILGRIGRHNIAIAPLPEGHYGTTRATRVLTDLRTTFSAVSRCLLVGIGAGFPRLPLEDIRLGDVIVGQKVISHDEGKLKGNARFQRTGDSMRPSQGMSTALSVLRARHEDLEVAAEIAQVARSRLSGKRGYERPTAVDRLFLSTYNHPPSAFDCEDCDQGRLAPRDLRTSYDPIIHYGTIASGNILLKNSAARDKLARELDVIGVEMEAAGLMGIVPTLVIRGVSDYADSHKNDRFQKYAAANAAAFAREYLGALKVLGTEQSANTEPSDPNGLENDPKLDRKDYSRRLSVLHFGQMNARQLSITGRLKYTCEWLFEHESYICWRDDSLLSEHQGFIWLKGKPGAGKSTIMRYVYEEHRKKKKGRGKIKASNIFLASFFFHARGEELQKSIEGMYRSLVYQLLKGFPDLQELLDDRGVAGLGDRQFICYVDALDECPEKQVQSIVRTFQDLAEEHNRRHCCFRVFFSSRHYPHIEPRIGLQLNLDKVSEHTDDMKQYAHTCLLFKDNNLRGKLVEKANGVFMWMILVVDILNGHHSRGNPTSAAERELEKLPRDLSSLFEEILSRHTDHMDEFIVAVLWLLFAKRPLSPVEFDFAIWSHSDYKAVDPPLTDNANSEERNRLQRRVIGATKALAEVTKNGQSSVVQLIHESVRDFLLKDKGLAQIWPGGPTNVEQRGHEELKKCCLFTLSLWGRLNGYLETGGIEEELRDLEDIFILLEYSVQNVFYHANGAEPGIDQNQFLARFELRAWITLSNRFESKKNKKHDLETDMLYLLADGGYAQLIKCLSKPLLMSCLSKGRYWSPLIAALAGKHSEAVSALLQIPVSQCSRSRLLNGLSDKTNLRYGRDRTLLSWAAEGGHVALAKILVQKGASIWSADPGGFTALERGMLRVGELFISSWDESPFAETAKMLEPSAIYAGLLDILVSEDQDLKPTKAMEVVGTFHLERTKGASLKYTIGLFMCCFHCQDSRWSYGKIIQGAGSKGLAIFVRIAARIGSLNTLQQLVDNGADIAYLIDKEPMVWRGKGFKSPLKQALDRTDLSVADYLVSQGADLWNGGVWGDSAFKHALETDDIRVLDWIVTKDPTIDWRVVYGPQPLLEAAEFSPGEAIPWLLAKGATVDGCDEAGTTPLMQASRRRNSATVDLLLQAGANANAKDHQGCTSIMFAYQEFPSPLTEDRKTETERGRDTVKLLLKYGAAVDAVSHEGGTALMWASKSGDSYDLELLLEAGANIGAQNSQGRTPLLLAAQKGCVDAIEKLRAAGASVHAQDQKGMTALMLAAQRRSTRKSDRILQTLLEAGADVNIRDNEGRTALMFAAQRDDPAGLGRILESQTLLDAGADVNIRDNEGMTALMFAVRDRDDSVFIRLLKAGAEINVQDNEGRTALDHAQALAQEDTRAETKVRILQEQIEFPRILI
ncbi:hypothetical protein NLU13_8076 [Sarocladium strictum]|uniref:Nephrocystin 3-like N-terminal domain-containing protein n=1 Tax=Sarocladium strictum TaxID=5046 RepID=A0AA39L4M5_SARSR|nr:hypothetical protein NLU13_8076 [Sarocladium strictum]